MPDAFLRKLAQFRSLIFQTKLLGEERHCVFNQHGQVVQHYNHCPSSVSTPVPAEQPHCGNDWRRYEKTLRTPGGRGEECNS